MIAGEGVIAASSRTNSAPFSQLSWVYERRYFQPKIPFKIVHHL
jgi:hypothetical protein